MSLRILCGAGLGVMTALLGAQTTNSVAVLGLPSDGDIRRILVERVDAQGKGIGIIVGVIEPGGRGVISYGEQALGWMITGKGGDQLIVHDGGTFGFASSMVWDAKKRVGVVVLSNHVVPVGDLARHVRQPQVHVIAGGDDRLLLRRAGVLANELSRRRADCNEGLAVVDLARSTAQCATNAGYV